MRIRSACVFLCSSRPAFRAGCFGSGALTRFPVLESEISFVCVMFKGTDYLAADSSWPIRSPWPGALILGAKLRLRVFSLFSPQPPMFGEESSLCRNPNRRRQCYPQGRRSAVPCQPGLVELSLSILCSLHPAKPRASDG